MVPNAQQPWPTMTFVLANHDPDVVAGPLLNPLESDLCDERAWLGSHRSQLGAAISSLAPDPRSTHLQANIRTYAL